MLVSLLLVLLLSLLLFAPSVCVGQGVHGSGTLAKGLGVGKEGPRDWRERIRATAVNHQAQVMRMRLGACTDRKP